MQFMANGAIIWTRCLHLVDDNVILYPAGHLVVLYNVETRQQRFIFGSEGSEITALAVSPNKRYGDDFS